MESTPKISDLATHFFKLIIHNKESVVKGFRFVYGLIGIAMLLMAWWIWRSEQMALTYQTSLWSGQLAIVLFCVSILPGILRRFGIRSMFTASLMSVRRQIGVTMFLLSLLHYMGLRLFPVLLGGVPLMIPPPTFEFIGVLALYSLFALYVTSNDASVKKMGAWWRRLHTMIYGIVWLLFLHTAMQRTSIWSILIGVFAALEIASLVYVVAKHHLRHET